MIIGNTKIGAGYPCYIVAEIGINHNGDIGIAKELIRIAADAGANAVKLQKRDPDIVTPEEKREQIRYDTPWGDVRYIDYRWNVEFGQEEYNQIDFTCRVNNIDWFASPWDIKSVHFLQNYNPVAVKVASAMLTHKELIGEIGKLEVPTIMSKGGSTLTDLDNAIHDLGHEDFAALHCVSRYPCPDENLHLQDIPYLRKHLRAGGHDVPVGYSGHEIGLATTVAAVVLGADIAERHITLDRSMWGSDQGASIEPQGLKRLVRDIRAVEKSMSGGGKCEPQDIEQGVMDKLRYFEEQA